MTFLGLRNSMNIIRDHKYYLFFDLDETLMFDGIISEENIVALKKAQEKGHEIFLSTGRTKGFLPDEVNKINFDGYLLAASYIEYKNKILCSSYIEENVIKKCINIIKKSKKGANFEGENNYFDISEEMIKDLNDEEFDRLLSSFDFVNSKIAKVTFHYKLNKEEEKQINELEKVFFSYKTECVPLGNTKGNLIKKFGSIIKVTKDNFIVFGDSENDVSMFNAVKNNIAICPSSKKIRNMAKLIIFKKENGVAIALKTLGLID